VDDDGGRVIVDDDDGGRSIHSTLSPVEFTAGEPEVTDDHVGVGHGIAAFEVSTGEFGMLVDDVRPRRTGQVHDLSKPIDRLPDDRVVQVYAPSPGGDGRPPSAYGSTGRWRVQSRDCTTGSCSARSRSRSSVPTWIDTGACTHL
jgi:hypothetical protein